MGVIQLYCLVCDLWYETSWQAKADAKVRQHEIDTGHRMRPATEHDRDPADRGSRS